jgi:hypothetical protein
VRDAERFREPRQAVQIRRVGKRRWISGPHDDAA